MEDNKTRLGLNQKIVNVFHKLMLIVILHSSFVAPSQNLIIDYFNNTEPNKYIGSVDNYNEIQNLSNDKKNSSNKFFKNGRLSTVINSRENLVASSVSTFQIESDIESGVVGVSNQNPLDDATDNLFKFKIKELPSKNAKVFLRYDLYGVQDLNAVTRSVNDRPATGGYLVKIHNNWTSQKEELDIDWLKSGENKIIFTTPKNANYQYQVKNVKLEFELDSNNSSSSSIVINSSSVNFAKDNKVYIKGFLKKFNSDVKIVVEQNTLNFLNGEFEGFIDLTDEIKKRNFVVINAFDNKGHIGQQIISLDNILVADKLFEIENLLESKKLKVKTLTLASLEIDGAKLIINDSALVEDKELSISKLRSVDLAPMASGMINVTKGGAGYRFLPDGTKFENPVQIELEYDEKLIPKGRSVNDIKTFYFNTNLKKWIAIDRDTINVENRSVLSYTDHFSDYINGIIQTPESPETAGFTPTMMSDIKAVDPSSEMTLISPPEVSQKGDANLSYPIKIPAGRNGLQPQLSIQYSSDGGNGWLGEGWGLSTPAISIDTRWGVPIFNPEKESEIYTLNGEQLMYPKVTNLDGIKVDWMPNRHYDKSNIPNGFSTVDIDRTSNLLFTPRKQGSFAKIERLGNSPLNYYWKVTSTDGSVFWYGGKDGVVDNAVIKNDNGNIVHWSLFMIEDIHSNNVKYEYTKLLINGLSGNNSNLNNGLVYNVKNIFYTGYNGNNGIYTVEFVNESNILRPDISITSKLGYKLINPYRLDQIKVLNANGLIRSYKLNYTIGQFNKTLLLSLTEKDNNGVEFYKHNFEYYDDVAENNNALFGEAVFVNMPKQDINYIYNFGGLINSSFINTTQNIESGFDFRIALGLEWRRKTNSHFRNITFGFPFSFSKSSGDGKVNLVDIDGDGLDDMVFKSSTGLKFAPHIYDPISETHSFGSIKQINNIGSFYHSKGKTDTKLLPFDIAFGKKRKYYLGFKKFLNKNYTDIYFTDGNGDGLMDIVKDNKVYFNYLNANQEPTFSTSSENSPNLVITADVVPDEPNPLDEIEEGENFINLKTNYDAVKVWVSPGGGYIQIKDIVTLNSNDATDKVIYSIETSTKGPDTYNSPVRVYLKELTHANPTAFISVSNFNTYNPPLGINSNEVFSVTEGQKVYFRIHKNSNSENCIVNSDPKIIYTSSSSNPIDENGINQDESKYSDSFILSDEDFFEIPAEGTLSVDWTNVNVNNLSDDVTFKIIKVTDNNNTISEQVVYEKFCNQYSNTNVLPSSNSLSFNVNNLTIGTLGATESVYFYATVNSDSNVRWRDIIWKPKFTYTPSQSAIANDSTLTNIEKYLIPKYSIYSAKSSYNKYNFGPYYDTTAPNCAITWNTPNSNQTYGIKFNNIIDSSHNHLTSNDNGSFTIVYKKDGHYIEKRTVTISGGSVIVSNNNDPVNFYSGNIYNITSPVNISVELYFKDFVSYEIFERLKLSMPAVIKEYNVQGQSGCWRKVNGLFYVGYDWSTPLPQNTQYLLGNTVDYFSGIGHSVFIEGLNTALGPLYNNWGQFFYNDELDPSTTIPSDSFGKLINNAIVNDPSITYNNNLLSQLGVDLSLCQNSSDPEGCVNDQILSNLGLPMNGNDFPDYSEADIDQLEANFNNLMQVPAICLLPGRPVRNIDSVTGNQIERWEGIFSSNFISEFQGQVGDFSQTALGNLPDNEDENILFPPQQANINTGMFALSKYHRSVSRTITFGRGRFNLSKSNSNGNGKFSHAKNDFIDLNGDRYPDIFTDDNIRYTNMTGGHKSLSGNHNFGEITNSHNSNLGLTLSMNYLNSGKGEEPSGSDPNASSDSNESESGTQNKLVFGSGSPSARMGISVNLAGENYGKKFWQDINGDGLADRVNITDNTFSVQFNKGVLDNTVPNELFNGLSTNKTQPSPLALSLGITPINIVGQNLSNTLNMSFQVDLGFSTSGGNSKIILQDINSDGLTDVIVDDHVKINNGNTYTNQTIPLSVNTLDFNNDSRSTSLSAAGSASLYFRLFRIGLFVVVKGGFSLGGNYNLTLSETNKSLKDFDGDGYLDFVEKTYSGIKYFPSSIKRTNKLKTVTNPLGGKFTVDYEVQPVSYDNPHAKWTMSYLTIEDGYSTVNDGEDIYEKQFKYENGKYDRREREFYGFKTVKVEDYKIVSQGTSTIYRTSVTNYLNQSYFLNGLVESSYVIQGNDENKKFSKAKNHYEIYALNDSNDEINLSTALPANFDVGGTEGRRSAIVLLTKSITDLYELDPSPQLTTEVRMKYDSKGRVIEYINKGNILDNTDDYSSVIEYHNSMNALNIISVPQSIKVSTPSLGLVRERTTDVDSSNGNIVKISANNNGNWALTRMEYDQYGNLIQIIYPQNSAGESMSYDYTYDSVYNKYVIKIKDAFGYSSSATYDSNFDKPLEVLDLTGNKMIYTYDNFGRSTKIIAPKEILASKPYTIKFEYYPFLSQIPSGSGLTASNFVPVAVTSHYDQQNPANDIQTFTFIDGMARPIQVKKDIYYNNGTTEEPNFIEALSISGKSKFDEFGRVIEQYHPYWEVKLNTTKFLLNNYSSPFMSQTFFDELDRPIMSVDPEGNTSSVVYSIDTDDDGILAIKTKTDVDQNGSQNIVSEVFKDVSGRVISTNNVGGTTGNIWTRFKYNEIGELLEYIDDEGISTTYKYDMFGRKIEVNHPDNGKTTYQYDNVNLVSLQTANLESQGTLINYEYEINRLVKIIFPDLPSGGSNLANVIYKYGSSGNETGRLIYQEDATGTQEMFYGNMGELTTNVRTVVGPNIPTRQFKTNFQYDSWNRLQAMQYPDGEKITYNYDLGGNLTRMTGELNGSAYDYIKRIDYDYFEQRTYLLYGNETETFYDYTPSLRRLNNLNVKTSDGLNLFDNNYEYDKVGNVTSLINSAGVTANDMAGKYSHKFDYDNLNRLISAEGSFEGSANQLSLGNDANSTYTLTMEYISTHGIANKKQEHIKNGTTFFPNTYDNTYNYIPNTHKVEKIVNNATGDAEIFKYDANGNITVRNDNNLTRELFWDESNRLRVVSDNHSMQHYIYDASGERVLKANSDMEAVYQNGELVNAPGSVSINGYTSYPSAFIVITADGVYSKHYYAGTQRIVSRLGDDDAGIFEIGCMGCKQEPSKTSFDDSKLKQAQKQDLNLFAEKAKKGKVIVKDYKPVSLQEQEKALVEEEEESKVIEKAPIASPIYYYHPDHLGTSTALTDFNGNAYQFFLNLPFGETMAQQLGNNYYNSPFKFNGKELDEETGFYYYGARYYDPKISIWLSIDPLVEKTMQPYSAFNNNPIRYNDPTGMIAEEGDPGKKSWLSRAWGEVKSWFSSDDEYKPIKKGRVQVEVGPGYFEPYNEELQTGSSWYSNGITSTVVNSTTVVNQPNVGTPFYSFIYPNNLGSWGQTGSDGKVWIGCMSCHGQNGAYTYAAHNSQEAIAGNFAASIFNVAYGTSLSNRRVNVFRAFGGDARAQGFSWTPTNPESVSDFRNLAGLPSGGASGSVNTAEFLIQGRVHMNDIIKTRSALPLDGNIGGLPEFIIDPKNVRITNFKVIKP